MADCDPMAARNGLSRQTCKLGNLTSSLPAKTHCSRTTSYAAVRVLRRAYITNGRRTSWTEAAQPCRGHGENRRASAGSLAIRRALPIAWSCHGACNHPRRLCLGLSRRRHLPDYRRCAQASSDIANAAVPLTSEPLDIKPRKPSTIPDATGATHPLARVMQSAHNGGSQWTDHNGS